MIPYLLHSLFELALFSLVAWWLDRRNGQRAGYLLAQLEAPPLELETPPAEPEPPPAPAEPCPADRLGVRCAKLAGHAGDHANRRGVTWRGDEP